MENPSYKAPKDFTSFDVEKFINDNYGWLIRWLDNPINYFTSEEYKLANDKQDPYGFAEFICRGSVFRWQEHIKEILKALIFSKFCKIEPRGMTPQKMYCLSGFIEQTGRLPVKTDEVKLYYWGEDDKGVRFLQRITEGIITQYLTDIRIATINRKPIDHKIGTQKMKKYKLLKDLPGKKTGEIITLFQNDKLVKWYDKSNYEVCVDVTNPEWFEEVKSKDELSEEEKYHKYYRRIPPDKIKESDYYGTKQYFKELSKEELEKYKFGYQFEHIEGVGYVLKETKGYCNNTPLEESKEQPTTEPVLELFKISENIYSDGRAAGKTYKVELIGEGFDNKKPDIDNILKNIEPFCLFRNFMKLSDTEKEIIESLRKAKETGVSMNNFSMLRGAGGTMIQEGLNMFIKGATITGGTINK